MLHAANKITQQYKHTIELVNMHHFSTGCLLVFVPYQAYTGWRQQIFRLQQSYTVIIFLTQTCVMCTTKYFSLHIYIEHTINITFCITMCIFTFIFSLLLQSISHCLSQSISVIYQRQSSTEQHTVPSTVS